MAALIICRLIKTLGGYKILSPTDRELTPLQYFNSDDDAFRWAKNWVSSYPDWVVRWNHEE